MHAYMLACLGGSSFQLACRRLLVCVYAFVHFRGFVCCRVSMNFTVAVWIAGSFRTARVLSVNKTSSVCCTVILLADFHLLLAGKRRSVANCFFLGNLSSHSSLCIAALIMHIMRLCNRNTLILFSFTK